MPKSSVGFQREKYFPGLDGLRCISILAVTAFHCAVPWGRINVWGFRGVTLFFAISGFLITTLLLREKNASGDLSLRRFYARRSLRIFPLYYAVILFYTVMVWRTDRHSPQGREFFDNLKYFLTYTTNWFARPGAKFYLSWTLATEEQFYLFWPAVVAFTRRRVTPILVITGVLVMSLAVRALAHYKLLDNSAGAGKILNSASPAICMGCLLAYCLDSPSAFKRVAMMADQKWVGLILALATGAALWFEGLPEIVVETCAVAIVGLAVVSTSDPLQRILGNPVFRYVGSISYGMYLFNLVACNIGRNAAGNARPTLAFLISTAVAVSIASVSFYLYERPFLKLKSRFASGRPPIRETLVAEEAAL